MTDLTTRLRELNRLHASAVLNGTAAGDHNHLAAANRALFKAWPEIANEIDRLTGEVSRLEKNLVSLDIVIDGHIKCAWSWAEKIAMADALAEAAWYLVNGIGGRHQTLLDDLVAALTAYRDK